MFFWVLWIENFHFQFFPIFSLSLAPISISSIFPPSLRDVGGDVLSEEWLEEVEEEEEEGCLLLLVPMLDKLVGTDEVAITPLLLTFFWENKQNNKIKLRNWV